MNRRGPGRRLAPLAAVLFALVAGAGLAFHGIQGGGLPLKHVADIPLPGRTTRLDYESYDPDRHLLLIAHLGDGEVIVFDTQASRLVSRIGNVAAVHGVLVAPELSRVFASATGTNEVVAIDEASMKIVARMPGGIYPDGMAYAPDVQKLYVSDQTGATETVIDARTNTRVTMIPLGGEAGNTQYDPVSRHVFVNVQTRGQLVEIDPATDTIAARIDLPGARGNHGLLIEPRSRLAFVACEDDARLLVIDLHSKRVVAAESVGAEPDVLAFDPALSILYVASESGVVSMFKLAGGALRKLGEGRVAPRAHSVAVAPDTHHVYFPIESVNGRPVLRVMSPTP